MKMLGSSIRSISTKPPKAFVQRLDISWIRTQRVIVRQNRLCMIISASSKSTICKTKWSLGLILNRNKIKSISSRSQPQFQIKSMNKSTKVLSKKTSLPIFTALNQCSTNRMTPKKEINPFHPRNYSATRTMNSKRVGRYSNSPVAK